MKARAFKTQILNEAKKMNQAGIKFFYNLFFTITCNEGSFRWKIDTRFVNEEIDYMCRYFSEFVDMRTFKVSEFNADYDI